LLPGDSLPVALRFIPQGIVGYWDSLYVETDCGVPAGTRITGTGEDERVQVSITPVLLLSPGEFGEIAVLLDSLPARYTVNYISGTFYFDDSFVRFDAFRGNDAVLSTAGRLRATLRGDHVDFTVDRPDPFDRTGALLYFRVQAIEQGPECREIRLEGLSVRTGGINSRATGNVCINPSCRHPDGLYAIIAPEMRIYPHPVTEVSRIVLSLQHEDQITMQLVDLLGNTLRTICSATLSAGEHSFSLAPTGISEGVYFIRAKWSGGVIERSIVVPR
jgi:hypothetical protein